MTSSTSCTTTKSMDVEKTFRLEDFSCCVCFEFFKLPVTLSCGHTFCKACIRTLVLCPLCRQEARIKRQDTKLKKYMDELYVTCKRCLETLVLTAASTHASCGADFSDPYRWTDGRRQQSKRKRTLEGKGEPPPKRFDAGLPSDTHTPSSSSSDGGSCTTSSTNTSTSILVSSNGSNVTSDIGSTSTSHNTTNFQPTSGTMNTTGSTVSTNISSATTTVNTTTTTTTTTTSTTSNDASWRGNSPSGSTSGGTTTITPSVEYIGNSTNGDDRVIVVEDHQEPGVVDLTELQSLPCPMCEFATDSDADLCRHCASSHAGVVLRHTCPVCSQYNWGIDRVHRNVFHHVAAAHAGQRQADEELEDPDMLCAIRVSLREF